MIFVRVLRSDVAPPHHGNCFTILATAVGDALVCTNRHQVALVETLVGGGDISCACVCVCIIHRIPRESDAGLQERQHRNEEEEGRRIGGFLSSESGGTYPLIPPVDLSGVAIEIK